MIIHEELIGFISLGMKKSGEEYNQDDISILETLAGTASVAVSNAQYVVSTMQLEAEAAQQEKMAVIGTLAAGINHEICNPLGIARGQCEVFLLNQREGLYNNKSKDEQLTEAMKIMEKVMKETDRATTITKKLSSFAKPSKGEISYDVSIKNEISEVMALVGHELQLEKIDVNINISPDLPYIACDRKQLEQVLFNIVRNAGQAIGEKGVININAKAEDDKIRIDIEDTGCGIPKDKLTEIFNPFYTTKEPGKGTGLGLFIVRQLIERNKGKISVDSEVGQGTKVTLEFPVSEKVKV
jgi:signal transduction histidine kinase